MGKSSVRRGRFDAYRAFRQLDGSHPFQTHVPGGFVGYRVRRVTGARVVYFNFTLAREIGLIPRDHPDRLTLALSRRILDTFALQIVNEYDLTRGAPIAESDLLPGTYMATRYLQLQHPGRTGRTSGDGRSIWNGRIESPDGVWDVSSCGTGVTRLCPATAWTQRFYKTGSRVANYGCGTAAIEDGFATALMSETFHHNGIDTERALAVLELPNGYAINVRAGRNLLRPSHFFVHSRQQNVSALRGVADTFYENQVRNGRFPRLAGKARYRRLAHEIAQIYGRMAARFESEYVFVWLDWDGDNVLADGSIVDYGSVRQFGLYHREYRFDDGPVFSTTITEQRLMARRIVQHFAQLCDQLAGAPRRALAAYRRDPVLALFDAQFDRTRRLLLLHHAGLTPTQAEQLLGRRPKLVERFRRVHSWWERQRSQRGPKRVADGITWDAVFSVRDLMREIPARWTRELRWLSPREVIDIAASRYAARRDRRVTPARARWALELQRAYAALLTAAAQLAQRPPGELLAQAAQRSAVINRFARITGDSANYAARRLYLNRRRLSPEAIHALIRAFVVNQNLVPEREGGGAARLAGSDSRRVFDILMGAVAYYRHGI
jgi:hypothetical protein